MDSFRRARSGTNIFAFTRLAGLLWAVRRRIGSAIRSVSNSSRRRRSPARCASGSSISLRAALRVRSGLDIRRGNGRNLTRNMTRNRGQNPGAPTAAVPAAKQREFLMDDDLSVSAGGSAADRAERLTRSMRDQSFPNLKPRDSATLILVDRSSDVPKVLLGRRHQRHRFLPGKFVFPGGRIEPADRLIAAAAALHEQHARKLMQRMRRPSLAKAAAFALAAVRETYEETGIMVGMRTDQAVSVM